MSSKRHKHIGQPLDCLMEECAEVIQVICKVKRFGWRNTNPEGTKSYDNVAVLEDELRDVEQRIAEVREIMKGV